MSYDHCRLKLDEAQRFVAAHHRHCKPLRRHMWSTGAFKAGRPHTLIDVATIDVCSNHAWSLRPDHVEIRRLCTRSNTPSEPNAGSYLLATVTRACFAIGYRTVISYTQPYETGATLKTCGFTVQHRKKMRLIDGEIKGGLVQWMKSRAYTPSDDDLAFTRHVLEETNQIYRDWTQRIETAS